MELLPAVIFAGVANAALLAAVTALTVGREPRAAWLSTGLALLAISVAAIFVTHETEGSVEAIATAVEVAATLASGPVVYHMVRSCLGLRLDPRRTLAHFAPAAVAVLAAPVIAMQRWEAPSAELICLHQACYTSAAAWTFLKRRRKGDRSAYGFRWPLSVLTTMGGIHSGQIARFTVAGPGDVNIVAMLGATAAFGLLVIALSADRISAKVAGSRYVKSSLNATRSAAIYDRVRAELEQGLFRRPDLSLAELAKAAGAAPHHVSQALSEAGSTTFTELLAKYRVGEARRLLALADNAKVAVEPIGMEAGFKSRSAFYAAFREATGLSPAEYRRRAVQIVSSPIGEDTERRA